MDVVPYITKLYTGISSTAGEEFARSATGKYIVRGTNSSGTTENVRIYGFNLAAGTNAVKVGSTSRTPTNGGSDDAGSYLNLDIGTSTVSGELSITVNSIESLNNKNKNPVFASDTDDAITAVEYNGQTNGVTNNRLTDDVSLWVWDLNYFLQETNVTSPMLKMDKAGNYYMSYGYGVPSMYVNKNETTRSIDYSYNKFHNTNVAFDDNGHIYAVATNTDRISNSSARFAFYAPYGDNVYPDEVTSGKSSYTTPGLSRHHLEHAYNKKQGVYEIDRVKLPKITTYTSNSSNSTTVYIATSYYDANNSISPVKVRFGKSGNYVVKDDTSYTLIRNNSGLYYLQTKFDFGFFKIGNDYYPFTYYGSNSSGYYFYDVTGYTGNSITSKIYSYYDGGFKEDVNGYTDDDVVDQNMDESNDPSVTDSSAAGYHIIASDNTSKKGGQYASVGIIPAAKAGTTKNVGVVAWYDASASRVAYSYNTNPDSPVVGGAWQTNAKYLDGKYTGWHVDLTVDDEGGIHIAYYNSAKGDLKYVYLSKYDAEPSNPVTVDSYLSVGTNITINTRHEGGNYVPYIYYYNASSNQTPNSIKVAWRTDMKTLRDGARPDKTDGGAKDTFTGAWESMTIPTENIPVEATVCGGVPSTATGTNVYMNSTVFLGYMSDTGYEKAYIKK